MNLVGSFSAVDVGIGLGAGLVGMWLCLLGALAVARPRGNLLAESLRLLPDVLRLVKRLASDGSLPRGVRVRLWALLAYLSFPLDLVPDFIPVLGYADDAIIVSAVLRSVVRRAGPEAIEAHWPGSEGGLVVLRRLTGLPREPIPEERP